MSKKKAAPITPSKPQPTEPCATKFKLGDIVELRSGSPAMTISGIDPSNPEIGAIVTSIYFLDGRANALVAHENALQRVA